MTGENYRSEDDDAFLQRLALYQRWREETYRTEIVLHPGGGFYWSLFQRSDDERINGGLSDSRGEALKAANIAAHAALRQVRFGEKQA